MELLKNHRSIRKYQKKAINDALLNEIINDGCRASNTGNMQVYSIIVTRKEENKEKLSPCHFNQTMVKDAPVVLTFCADFNRFNKWCTYRNADAGYNNFLSFQTAAIDAIITAQNVCVAAEDRGLGICYLGTTIYTADKLIEILNLPKGVVPVTAITLGYPDEKPEFTDRLPLDAIVHYETYKDYTREKIDSIYKTKESMPENIGFVKENSKENLAQVFTDVRYTKANNEAFSEVLLKVLKDQQLL